ncbi:MAG: N-acetylmuramoyl-L-alanine amidase [Epsilonproteobacteria bacterium]|nr:N-acetylmuramoyl-L-alanine amidase [Campylobacterota bacterium]
MERTIITKSVWILLVSISLLFANNLADINALYKKIPYASKSETAKILHDLENLYISAVVAGDKKGVVKTLKGIVKCQKLLGLDASTYERELAEITTRQSQAKKSVQIKPNTGQKQVTSKNSSKPKPPEKKRVHAIRSIKQKNNTIIIKFDRPISKSQLLFFEINSNGRYKDIYDLKANLGFQAPKLNIKNIKSTKIAQNRIGKVRLVLEDQAKIYSNAYIRQGTLFIEVQQNPDKKQKVAPKVIQTKPQTSTKPSVTKKQKTKKRLYSSSKVIVIDPGHGGKDAGAVGYKKYQEKHAVLKVSKVLQGLLKKQGYKVYLTREKDKFIKLSNRTNFANKKEADLFISIHANASPSAQKLTLKGIETFFLSPAKTAKAKRIAAKENRSAVTNMNDMSKNTLLSFLNKTKIVQSNKLAIDIQKGMLSQVRKKHKDVRDGGVREAPFWVLVGAQMPAVLVEIGYITNPTEAGRLFNPFYQKSLAIGIANGINNYFINNQ